MEGQRAFFFFVLILFLLFTPDHTPRRRFIFGEEDLDDQKQRDFDILANATYGDLLQNGLNLTGFRDDDGYQWNLLQDAQKLSRQQNTNAWRDVQGRLSYSEITGEVRGKFKHSSLSSSRHPNLNLTAIDPRKEYVSTFWQRNITEKEGEISLTLHDSPDRALDAKEIRADIGLYVDSAPGNGWQANLRGVHFSGGYAVLSSFSTKFNSIPALPQFALDYNAFDLTKHVLKITLSRLWEKRLNEDPDLMGLPDCELIVWLMPKPLGHPEAYIRQVESELVQPEGAPIGEPPPMSFSAVIFSPDCGYILEADNIYGPKTEAYTRLAGRLLLAFMILLCLQITLLKRQMEKAATPSTRSRIAFQGIVIAALGDGLMLLAMIALLMLDEAGFLMVAAASFLACIHVAFLEVKFVFDIWTVQVGDPARAEYERQRRTAPAAVAPDPTRTAETNGLPLPATAPRVAGATPLIVASDGELEEGPPSARASFAAIYSRFYFTLVCLMFISLWAISWPRSLRSGYANALAFCYFSLWWPQIYRNAMRNCRKALAWEYVLGTSITRTIPILYWYFADRNILSVETSPTTAYILLGWVCLQVTIMASQRFLGPRLLVKDSWFPPAYDYHPLLQDDDMEAGVMSIGLLASASEAKDKDDETRKVFDCAICMNEINVPVRSNSEPANGTGTTWLERLNYMVTPCRHIFHAECLEGWMNLRLVCPVCREQLPPM